LVSSSFLFYLTLQYRNCTNTEYQCENGRCDPRSARPVMDSKSNSSGLLLVLTILYIFSNDCHENWAEKPSLCQAEQCPAGQFQCRNKKCIPYEVVCDGVRNCTDGSEEPVSCGKRWFVSRKILIRFISFVTYMYNSKNHFEF
jgi:hypothetical protein